MSVCLDGDRRRAGPERIRQARCDFDPSDPGAVFASARSRDVRLATKMLLTKAEQVSDDGAHAAALRASSGHDGPVAASARSGSAYGRTERGADFCGFVDGEVARISPLPWSSALMRMRTSRR